MTVDLPTPPASLLSSENNCIIYNCIYHNQTHQTMFDMELLKNLRATAEQDAVMDYYGRCKNLVPRINAAENSKEIWDKIYRNHVQRVLVLLSAGDTQRAIESLNAMLVDVENRY